ncbi:AAA family ATPase [Halobaculum sp. MBLA0147]|uniref:AAA family ATPase n=1 Tax=Halobaculum sp. MBLA0147 TaxID=3079934 RepID=UPI003525D7E8
MSHVERVHISDFKCLSEVDLECGQFNVLTGRNGTGKTSILEAIRLAHDPTALESYRSAVGNLIAVGEKSLSVELTTVDDSLRFQLDCPDASETHSLMAEAAVGHTMIEKPSELVFLSSYYNDIGEHVEWIEDMFQKTETEPVNMAVRVQTEDYDDFFVSLGSSVTISLSEMGDRPESPYEDNTEGVHIRRFGEFTGEPPAVEPIRLVDPAGQTPVRSPEDSELRRVRVRDFLREHDILPNLESFGFDELVFDENGSHHSIPYEFLGEGTKTVVEVVWQLLAEEEIPDVILLEEPENHLHPGYVKELVVFLIEFAREEDVQLFVTTHNVDFLTEFFNDATVGDHTDWLREEFRLIQTTELSPKQFDYERAREHVEDLQLDLRGL